MSGGHTLLAFRTSAKQILELAGKGHLAERVAAHLARAGYRISASERSSWEQSLPALAVQLADAGLEDLDALVECQLPRSSKRIDVILAGMEPLSRRPVYLVVELKQWSAATSYDEVENLLSVPGVAEPQVHPALQVQNYSSYLTDFLPMFWERPDAVHGLAYLHNAEQHQVPALPAVGDRRGDHRRMVFTRDRAEEMRRYLTGRFAPWRDEFAARTLLTAAVKPSRQLLTFTATEVESRRHLVLLDEQRAAYELVMRGVRWADRGRRKRVVVVAGGPGSGKSAIALTLLADLAREGRPVAHATGSKAFRETLQRYARSQPSSAEQRIAPLFHYFMDFMDEPADSLDVLICDEAHRIRDQSTRGTSRGWKSQVRELIEVAKVPVFLLDDDQVVRPNEVGSVALIRDEAERLDLEVDFVHLGAQFRCGGSPRYERWVRHLLGLAGDRPYRWTEDDSFRLALANSPHQMEMLLRNAHDRPASARISAGFCWPWTEKPRGRELAPEVRIGSWSKPWNAKGKRPPRGIPSSSYWASDPAGFEQVGCIYTAQGFEYDWSGVIIGPDLVFRGGRLVSQPSESHDNAIFDRRRGVAARDADRLIRNTYKVLLTRGLRGTLIHSADPDTQRFLTSLVPAAQVPGTLVAEGVRLMGARADVMESLPDRSSGQNPRAPRTGTARPPGAR
ncbi:DNA/RNA helicase domain-containing protein [Micromonospora sediminicola]|uniref:DNA/RNA helicase domain-containing protein n=1 Tax=Micromonospora sediminicola TaxID=946078 RepID=UPI0037B44817